MSLWRRVFAERRGVVLPLLLFLGANLAVLALVVLPLRQSVVRAEADAMDARAALAAAMQADQQARTARTSTDNAGVELGTFYTEILPASLHEADDLFFWLESRARLHGVQFRGDVSAYDEVRESRLWRVSNQAGLTGQYADILQFLYDVETAPEFVIIERVQLAQAGSGEPGAGGELELVLDVATYFLGAPPPGVPTTSGGGSQ
jgi:hypothetical protein